MSTKNKKGYFVFFGPANVGKSTMVGYILTQCWTKGKLLQQENKLKEKIGKDYQDNRFYSYLVDDAQDEYKKNSENQLGTTHGTSKYTHIRDVESYVLIDTPGGNDYEIQRYKGLSLANVGIFAIEIKQLLDMQDTINGEDEQRIKLVREFFSSWYVWQKMYGTNNTIILLTKYDLNRGKENYEIAKDVLSKIIGDDAINTATIIPTSVGLQAGSREDTNVFTKLDEDWYKGETLIQTIKNKTDSVSSSDNENSLLMFYNQDFNVRNVGYTIKWKVVNGIISTKDKIKIAPVLAKGRYTSILATIKSMQNNNKEAVEFGETGDIISTALSSIVDDNSRIPQKEISICKTAIIIDKDREVKIGNKIIIDINTGSCTDKELQVIGKVNINEQIRLLWYGRVLHPYICSKNDMQGGKIILELELNNQTEQESRQIALPTDILPKKTLLQVVKNQSELSYNYNCEVTDIS